MLYYTKNRFNIVTRYKPPACPGGELDTAFYTKTFTKYGYVTTPEHIVQPDKKVQEYTFSTFGYFGPLDEAKVELHVRSNCVLTPQTPTQTPTSFPQLPTLPLLPKEPASVAPATVEPKVPLSQEELFRKLVPSSKPRIQESKSAESAIPTDSTPPRKEVQQVPGALP